MEPTVNEPDEVTQAALETVSEAVELTDTGVVNKGKRRGVAPRRHGLRGIRDRLARRAARRADRVTSTRRLGVAISNAARRGAQVTGRGMSSGGRWLSGQVLAMAPRLPVRDVNTLRSQYPEHTPDQIADALIEGASRASATIGVAVGAWSVLPFVPAAGVEIATETLSVVGIEIKLVAELHEVYGIRAPGGVIERMTAYVGAWAQRRGVGLAPSGLVLAAGSPLARQLQRRLATRAGRSAFSLGPLLTGAIAGGLINRRETRKLGRILRDDLRARSPFADGYPII